MKLQVNVKKGYDPFTSKEGLLSRKNAITEILKILDEDCEKLKDLYKNKPFLQDAQHLIPNTNFKKNYLITCACITEYHIFETEIRDLLLSDEEGTDKIRHKKDKHLPKIPKNELIELPLQLNSFMNRALWNLSKDYYIPKDLWEKLVIQFELQITDFKHVNAHFFTKEDLYRYFSWLENFWDILIKEVKING